MKRWTAALCALALIGCSALALMWTIDMGRTWRGSTACAIEPMVPRALSSATEAHPKIGWTAYAQSAPQSMLNDALPGREVKAAVLRFFGAPERIAPLPLASGRLPGDGERGACALDTATAFALFGSVNPKGEWVRLGGEVFQVAGVFEAERALIVVAATDEDALDRLVADDRDALGALATALGATLDPFELSGAETAGLMWLLCAVPWVLAVAAAIRSLRWRGEPWRTAAVVLAWTLALGALLLAMRSVPVRLLPARWSDFSFYGEQVALWNAHPLRASDVRDWGMGADAWRVIWWCVGASVAAVGAARRDG